MLHVVEAGPPDDRRKAHWSSTTGQVDGDPVIVMAAHAQTEVVLHPEDPPHLFDWTSGKTAIPAMERAAQEAYGQPVLYYKIFEDGEEEAIAAQAEHEAAKKLTNRETDDAQIGTYLGRPISVITEQILSYRSGGMSFDELASVLQQRTFLDPPHYRLANWTYDDIEEADRSAPGTWGEVQACYNGGLLTLDEYKAISDP